jgi:hypothetical protein
MNLTPQTTQSGPILSGLSRTAGVVDPANQ